MEDLKSKALRYHIGGKVGTNTLTPLRDGEDLSLAYSPGVAYPCKEIEANQDLAYKYTAKGNLMAVISNGTAVLGLGDIGALAGKPVMEGKAVLFKKFANLDCYDIEVDEKDPDKFIEIVKAISPTFGAINLEDIKGPECFYIEKRLKEELDIPVMHDDQHGTAIVSSAAIINAAHIVGKKLEDLKVVVLGAGAAAIACSKMYKNLGIKNILMFDTKGIITTSRTDLSEYKKEFAIDANNKMTIKEALKGADVVLGLAKADILTPDDIKEMNKDPLIFALSNPNPEIKPEIALQARSDAIIATGRSDYPNQINNVLGFPYIFLAALKCKAKKINEEMKIAAAYALSELARKEAPKELEKIYNTKLQFGKDYIVPKPLDPRLKDALVPEIIKAAIKSKITKE